MDINFRSQYFFYKGEWGVRGPPGRSGQNGGQGPVGAPGIKGSQGYLELMGIEDL